MLQCRAGLLNHGNYGKCCISAQCQCYDGVVGLGLCEDSRKLSEGKNSFLMTPMQSNLGLSGSRWHAPCWWAVQFRTLMYCFTFWKLTQMFFFLSYKRHLQTFPCSTKRECPSFWSFLFSILLFISFLISSLFSSLLFLPRLFSSVLISSVFLLFLVISFHVSSLLLLLWLVLS